MRNKFKRRLLGIEYTKRIPVTLSGRFRVRLGIELAKSTHIHRHGIKLIFREAAN